MLIRLGVPARHRDLGSVGASGEGDGEETLSETAEQEASQEALATQSFTVCRVIY